MRVWGPNGTAYAGAGTFLFCFYCSCFFLSVFCATACRGESLMREPSDLLAPSLRVSLSLSIGGVRRAAAQRSGGLWLSHARGASTTTPRAIRDPAPRGSLEGFRSSLP